MVRAFLEPSDFYPIVAKLVPFCYGLALFIQSALDYEICSPTASAYALIASTWLRALAYNHYQLKIHCWFHYVLESLSMLFSITFIIWGFIEYNSSKISICTLTIKNAIFQLGIVFSIILVTWLTFSIYRIYDWAQTDKSIRSKFTAKKAELYEAAVRFIALAFFIVLFGIIADTSNEHINHLWMSTLVLGTIFIQMCVTVMFWRFDTIIQVISEYILFADVFVWFCFGWHSYNIKDYSSNHSVNSSLGVLVTLAFIILLWLASLIDRTIVFHKEYKVESKAHYSKDLKQRIIANENSTFTDYNGATFFPHVTNVVDNAIHNPSNSNHHKAHHSK